MLECKGLIKHLKSEKLVQKKIDYRDIYEDTLKQKNVTALFSELLKVKKELTESYHPSTSSVRGKSRLCDSITQT